MITESQIRQKLAALFNGQLSLADFERWLGSASRSMHHDSAPEAVRMAANIHHLFAAFDTGYVSEERLYQELRFLLNNIQESISEPLESLARHSLISASSAVVVPLRRSILPVVG